ncbi:hypothetical protein [Burkholderia sp. Bp8963]|uniref:hypothetical protein n=1 Tax=Burkholderia sp. Bp8963 TaxID=2184547 RepID=UPI000F59B900|nr:hypothetical protein [Burkholderia sp. Bp8963]
MSERRQRGFAESEFRLEVTKPRTRVGFGVFVEQNAQCLDDRRFAGIRFTVERDCERVPARMSPERVDALNEIGANRGDERFDLRHRLRDARIRRVEIELLQQIVDFIQYGLV